MFAYVVVTLIVIAIVTFAYLRKTCNYTMYFMTLCENLVSEATSPVGFSDPGLLSLGKSLLVHQCWNCS